MTDQVCRGMSSDSAYKNNAMRVILPININILKDALVLLDFQLLGERSTCL